MNTLNTIRRDAKLRLILAAIAALVAGGCTTTLKVTRVDPTKPETRVGAPHPLMFSRYEISVNRQVVGCGSHVVIAVKAAVKGPSAAPDPANEFVIDPNSLASPFKTSEVTVGYLASGGPGSLNAVADDRTAQVVAGVASMAVGIAKLAAVPYPAGGGESCSNDVLKALENIEPQQQALDAASKLLDARTSNLTALVDKIAAMGPNVDEGTKKDFGDAVDALRDAAGDAKQKEAALSKTAKAITHVSTVYWPEDGNTAAGANELPLAVFGSWTSDTADANDRLKATVHFTIEGVDASKRKPGTVASAVNPDLGIPIRQPATGRLTVCVERACADDNLPITTKVDEILQIGTVYYLECRSRPFSSIACSYSLSDNGLLKTMGTANKAAIAEGMVGAANNVVAGATDIRQVQSERTLKQLQAETALLKAEADRKAAEDALATDPLKDSKTATAALNATTELLNAQRAQLEAELALADAQARMARQP